MMDKAWDNMEIPKDGHISSMFQGRIIRDFKGSDGLHFSQSGDENAGRYLFTVCGDWFNPLTNKISGQKISILPGPHEPSLTANTFLRPLIDVFILLWTGVWFSRTCLAKTGRWIFCAIIGVIGDLPAARKLGGFSAFSHAYYCSFCWCKLPESHSKKAPPGRNTGQPAEAEVEDCEACRCVQSEHSYGCWNIGIWKRRTCDETKECASKFLEATDANAAQSLFDQSGVRWTEFLRLPYFDPARFVVIEPMHNLFLGLVKEHFSHVLGYTQSRSRPIVLPIDIPEPIEGLELKEKEDLNHRDRILNRLQGPMEGLDDDQGFTEYISKFMTYRLNALEYVARGLARMSSASSPHRTSPPLSHPTHPTAVKATRASCASQILKWRKAQTMEARPSASHPNDIPTFVVIDIIPSEENPELTDEKDIKDRDWIIQLLQGPMEELETEQGLAAAIQKLAKRRLNALKYISNGLSLTLLPRKDKGKKMLFVKQILSWRRAQIIEDESLILSGLDVPGAVLSTPEMESLWSDIRTMVKPSWVTSVPPDLGDHTCKLKADQWRIAATLYYPVTLIRLWSVASDTDDVALRRSRILSLTMSLISAINIASSRQTSQANADEYLRLYTQYIQELNQLFPSYKFRPNHHLAFHISEYLSLYGPVHGWWSYAMERVIGKLQRISTNYIAGQYEKTISMTWHRRSALYAFLDSYEPTIRLMRTIFRRLVVPSTRAAVATDLGERTDSSSGPVYTLSKKAKLLSPKELNDLRQQGRPIPDLPRADFFSSVVLKGLNFSIRDKHIGNSQVVVSSGDLHPFFAEINSIFRLDGQPMNEVWLQVTCFKLPPKATTDPYRTWPHIKAQLISREMEPKRRTIHSSLIISHFARCDVEWQGSPLAVAISLTRELLVPSGVDVDDEEGSVDAALSMARVCIFSLSKCLSSSLTLITLDRKALLVTSEVVEHDEEHGLETD
ncbi:hypothetical protein ONZ45_g18882 [Pleurotus djamor]|nr:hypothetical protein ONZ45_g18882 [Pleurotus djamor]